MSSSLNVWGHEVIADVPPEMGGDDRGPTPVDLLAGPLGTCIACYIARWCKEAQIACDGFEVKVDYVHDRENHCVPVLGVEVSMPAAFPVERKPALLKAAKQCTVHNTLCRLPEITVAMAHETSGKEGLLPAGIAPSPDTLRCGRDAADARLRYRADAERTRGPADP